MAFRFEYNNLLNGIMSLENKTDAAIKMYGQTSALKMEKYMKENRLWTDRTGAARNRLKGELERYDDGHRIKLSQNVWYGVYLEYAHEQKYAIIAPTIKIEGPKVIRGLSNIMGKVGKVD